MKQFILYTRSPVEFIDITLQVSEIIKDSKVGDGICHIFIPHTTAAVTINESADPSVLLDLKEEMSKIVPFKDNYRHLEGNSAAHIKASLFGASETLFIEKGTLLLGQWQGIFFCEFDGPRQRKVIVRIGR